jgi:hypothetical protein
MTGPGYLAESTVAVVPAVTKEAIEAVIARTTRDALPPRLLAADERVGR